MLKLSDIVKEWTKDKEWINVYYSISTDRYIISIGNHYTAAWINNQLNYINVWIDGCKHFDDLKLALIPSDPKFFEKLLKHLVTFKNIFKV